MAPFRYTMRRLLFPLLLAACSSDPAPPADDGGDGGQTVSFALDIQPVLTQDCIICHGGAGGLSVDTYAGLMTGGTSGPIVVAGDPDQSLLIRRLEGTVTPTMPLNAPPLTSPEIDRIKQWILEGALNN
jgi:mono/diheme cytochrome c family protein